MLCKARKLARETLAMIRQASGEESMEKSKLSESEKGDTREEQSKMHALHFLWH
jgi:hypothetical protein